MKSVWLYRVSAGIFILFAAGHTFGFLSFRPPTAEGVAVLEAMNRVHFQMQGKDFSYGGFYKGFGLDITLYMLFSAFLAWHLSKLVRKAPETIAVLGWAFVALQLAGLVLTFLYFGAGPAIFGLIVAGCLSWANLALPRSPG